MSRPTLRRVQGAHNELQAELEMLVDSQEGIHWGIINLSGYTYFGQPTPGERQHSLERGNLIASKTMGVQRYVQSIRGANRGVVHDGQDTDVGMAEEGGESAGEPTNDPEVRLAPSVGDFTQVMETMRNELNDCLKRESWAEIWQLQNVCLRVLDTVNRNQPVPAEDRRNLFANLSITLRQMSEQQSVQAPIIAARYQQYSHQLREMSLV